MIFVLFQSCKSDWPQEQYPNLQVGECWIDIFDQRGLQNAKVVGDKLFCNTINFDKPDYLYCLSLTTGKVVWKYPTSNYASQSIVTFEDEIYFSSYVGEISKISMQGNEIWKIKFPSSYAGHKINPLNGNLFVNSVVNGFYEFDRNSGELVHHYKFKNYSGVHHYTMPIIFESNLIFGNIEIDSNRNESFIAIDYESKKRVWESNLKKPVRRDNKTIPLLKENYLVSIQQHRDSIHCINAKNGELVWSQKIDKRADKNWSLRYCIEGDNVIYHKGDFVGLNLKSGIENTIKIENQATIFKINKEGEIYLIKITDRLEKSDLEIIIEKT